MSGLLAGINYDPGVAVAKATDTLQAMTAIDTTNLRNTFTAPANGIVWVRMQTVMNGSTTSSQVLLGVMNGGSVVGRQAPTGTKGQTQVATSYMVYQCGFPVTGLTPSSSYSLDAAYGVETAGTGGTALRYGGPDNSTTNDAWGGFQYEIWDTPNLLGAILYDPASAVANKATSSNLALTALDTTNLRITFTAPTSGKVLVSMQCMGSGATTFPGILMGVLEGSTVRGRICPHQSLAGYDSTTTTHHVTRYDCPVTGLTPGNSYTWDAAYGVEVAIGSTNLKYGGPDDTTTDNAYGGFMYCVWAV